MPRTTTSWASTSNSAMREAAQEAVDFLRERFGLSAANALYALASIGVDFRVAEHRHR